MCEEMTDNQGDWYLISRDEKVGWGWVEGLGGGQGTQGQWQGQE